LVWRPNVAEVTDPRHHKKFEPGIWAWNSPGYERQHRRRFRFGSQDHLGIIDFLVSDGRGPITLFENKLRIRDDKALQETTEQGRSYALMLGSIILRSTRRYIDYSPTGAKAATYYNGHTALVSSGDTDRAIFRLRATRAATQAGRGTQHGHQGPVGQYEAGAYYPPAFLCARRTFEGELIY
jgi:hypothetical protein